MEYQVTNLLNGVNKLVKSVFGKHKRYQLQFNHEEDGFWYIDFPNWPFEHHNLMMVAGADLLCARLSDDDKFTYVEVIPSSCKMDYTDMIELTKVESSLTGGSTYSVSGLDDFNRDIWLCPVTLFVLGEYPKYIYIKKTMH